MEIGFKSELLDHKLRWNGAAFYYRYTNIQMVKLTANNQLRKSTTARRRRYTAPTLTQKRSCPGTDVNPWRKLRPRSVYGRCAHGTVECHRNPPFPGGSNPFFASANGHELPHTPTWTTNVGLNYQLDTAPGRWTLDANLLHNSGWFGEPDNQLSTQRAYNSISNTTLHPSAPSALPFSIGLWGRNLSNQLVYTAVSGNTSITSLGQYVLPAPTGSG